MHAPNALRAACAAGLCLVLTSAGCPDPETSPADTTDGATDATDTTTAPPDTDVVVELPPDCTTDADCADGQALPACQTATCDGGSCVLSALADGAECADDDPCTTGDRCDGGTCVAGTTPRCDDGNPCTTDGCDDDGQCVTTFNQRPCDDGDDCTSGDACFQGACVGTATDCDDGNPCTNDSCDAALGCVNTPRTGACDDGDACTVDETCQAGGVCGGGTARVCGDPDNMCQSATCDPVTGCAIEVISGACDDANACTENDICTEGVCAGELIVCDDMNTCTDDYCDVTLGCLTVDNILPCDDGDVCTVTDRCSAGACVGTGDNPACCDGPADCDDGDSCTVDTCMDGLCRNAPLDCDDANPCTEDTCDDGACVNAAWGPIPDTPTLVDAFDADAAAWTRSSTNAMVVWQRDTSMFRSAPASYYMGNVPAYSYDFGATRATARRTLAIPPGTASLSVWYLSDFEESASCTYDTLRAYIDDMQLAPALCASVDDWTEQVWDVSFWAGSTVTLELTFDTGEDGLNDGMGVWVDDITLTVAGAPDCCLTADDCDPDPGMSCAIPTCPASRCALDTSGCP